MKYYKLIPCDAKGSELRYAEEIVVPKSALSKMVFLRLKPHRGVNTVHLLEQIEHLSDMVGVPIVVVSKGTELLRVEKFKFSNNSTFTEGATK